MVMDRGRKLKDRRRRKMEITVPCFPWILGQEATGNRALALVRDGKLKGSKMKMKIHTDFSHRSTSLTPFHPILLIRTRSDSDQDEETCTSNELPPRILERDNVGSRSLRDSDEFRSRSTATQPLLPMVGPGKSLTSRVSTKRSKWADRGRPSAASTDGSRQFKRLERADALLLRRTGHHEREQYPRQLD